MLIDLLCITIIIVYTIGLSGFIDEISEIIWKRMYPKVKYNGWRIPKPFGCETCMTFWCGILYLLVTGCFSLYMLLYVAVLSFMTPVIATTLLFIKDAVIKLLDVLYKLIN